MTDVSNNVKINIDELDVSSVVLGSTFPAKLKKKKHFITQTFDNYRQ